MLFLLLLYPHHRRQCRSTLIETSVHGDGSAVAEAKGWKLQRFQRDACECYRQRPAGGCDAVAMCCVLECCWRRMMMMMMMMSSPGSSSCSKLIPVQRVDQISRYALTMV